ncbi:MAG: ABC-2 type transport system ATP-binding protein [Planctomycetota bacterium]
MKPSIIDPTSIAIQFKSLSVHFGRVVALDGMSAEIPSGATGLLGPNGAGKTTLIKILLGLLSPTSGSASISGLDPGRRMDKIELRRIVGYMPESDCLIPGRTGIELVASLGRITGLSREDAMTRAHEMLDYVGLEDQRYRQLDQYSTGMKQRLKLAQALVHDPKYLLLDEPTNGLDPKGRRHMLELIKDLGDSHGKNILLCSHLLPDVEKTCQHVLVINRGQVIESGSIEALTSAKESQLNVEIRGDFEAFESQLTKAKFQFADHGRGRYELSGYMGSDDADSIFAIANNANCNVLAVEPVRSSLEQVFMKVLHEAEAGQS